MERSGRRRVVFDTDGGLDDSIALLLALNSEELDVVAVTTVFGNTDLENVNTNVCKVLEFAGRSDVSVFSGASRPHTMERQKPTWGGHGRDGIGDTNFFPKPSKQVEEDEDAATALVRIVNEAPTTVVAVGPLTNLALAYEKDTNFFQNMEKLSVMGGSVFGRGNVAWSAEFNFFQDPEAAAIVLRAMTTVQTKSTTSPATSTTTTTLREDERFVLVPWEACEDGSLGWDFYDSITSPSNTRHSKFIAAVCSAYEHIYKPMVGKESDEDRDFILCDPLAVAVLLHADVVAEGERVHACVEVEGKGRGGVLYDWYGKEGKEKKNLFVVKAIDRRKYEEIIRNLAMKE